MTLCKSTILPAILLAGCTASGGTTVDVTGTIRSSFENFSFMPSNTQENHWINSESSEAIKWHIFDELHQPLLKQEWEAMETGNPFPILYFCVSGNGYMKAHKNGTGHMGLWSTEITFTEIKSAAVGKCED